jgi:malonate decarboxylase beta subunit
VWSTVGGRNRRLIGGADVYAADTFAGFRAAIAEALERVPRFEAATLRAENGRLADRLKRFEDCDAAADLFRALGASDAAKLQDMPDDAFVAIAKQHGDSCHDAR